MKQIMPAGVRKIGGFYDGTVVVLRFDHTIGMDDMIVQKKNNIGFIGFMKK